MRREVPACNVLLAPVWIFTFEAKGWILVWKCNDLDMKFIGYRGTWERRGRGGEGSKFLLLLGNLLGCGIRGGGRLT